MLPIPNGIYASFYSIAYALEPHAATQFTAGNQPMYDSLLIIACNSFIAKIIQTGSFKNMLLLPLALVVGIVVVNPNPVAHPTSLQPDVPIVAFQPALSPQMLELAAKNADIKLRIDFAVAATINDTTEHSALVLLPEAYFRSIDSVEYFSRLLHPALEAVLSGVSIPQEDGGHNSIAVADSLSTEKIYDKWQLIPVLESRMYQSGNAVSVLEMPNGKALGLLICMDGVNPWLFGQAVLAGAEFVVVLSASDYGWGYRTPSLHLQVVRHIAASFRTPTLFLTTAGPSALIDSDGSVNAQLERGVQGFLSTAIH